MDNLAQEVFSSVAFPAFPPLQGFRFAKPSDIPRIGVVAAASFYHSPVFQYQRPDHDKYPMDVVASYRDEFWREILNPDSVVLVKEREFDSTERDHVFDALSRIYPDLGDGVEADERGNIIVAVASFIFSSDSPRRGQFKLSPSEGGNLTSPPHDDMDKRRDQNAEGNRLYIQYTSPSKARWLRDRTRVGMTVTHPAYWRQGHSGALVKWFTDLADMDKQAVGVNAVDLGRLLFAHCGFELVEEAEVKGYERHPDSFSTWVGIREPQPE